jgi:hypothetical protein
MEDLSKALREVNASSSKFMLLVLLSLRPPMYEKKM